MDNKIDHNVHAFVNDRPSLRAGSKGHSMLNSPPKMVTRDLVIVSHRAFFADLELSFFFFLPCSFCSTKVLKDKSTVRNELQLLNHVQTFSFISQNVIILLFKLLDAIQWLGG